MRSAILVAVGVFATGTAHADNFFEADLGAAVPIADDDYDNNVSNSLKLGVRLGTATKFGGLDLSIDFTPFSDDLSSDAIDVSIQRYRFMLGGRYVHPITPKARFYVRAAGGLDLIHYNVSGSIIGIDIDQSETDAGIALQFDTGVLFDLGKVSVGARLGVPLAFHFNDDDPNDPNDADLSYTGVDIDFAFTLAVPF